jgi:GxxExxY protein
MAWSDPNLSHENALAIRLRKAGLKAAQQHPITVFFDDEIVGEYFADLVVADLILIEIKAAAQLAPEHHAQLLNYLKATSYEVGLLLNFGPQPQVVRKAYDNTRKRIGR